MLLLEIMLWSVAALVFWTYAGYPMLLVLLARFSRRRLQSAPIEPTVSVIIAAYNEEKNIGQKVENTLGLDYPPEKVEVIVVSDCSTDRTRAVVESYRARGVGYVELERRGGKTAAQNAAVAVARGEILVFTDATTMLEPGSLRELVTGFADPRVGCIDAVHESVTKGGSVVGKGSRTYRGYESWIKRLEAQVNSLIGVTGCLYAVRRSIYEPIAPDLISDFIIASKVYSKGFVSVSNTHIATRELSHEEVGKEFDMRVRIIVRSINGLVREVCMLNPFRYGLFSLQLLSHKVLRYLVPELLIAIFVLSLALALSDSPRAWHYRLLLQAQAAFFAAALIGWASLRLKVRVPLVHIPFYFVVSNFAALWGLLLYLKGERKITWTTVR